MKKRNKLLKLIKRFWESVKKSKVFIILGGMIVVIVLMIVLMLQQRDIGAKEAGQQIELLAQNIRNQYKVRPDYWGLSTNEVTDKKLYPDSMTINGGKLLGYFGNPVEIGMDDNGATIMPTIRYFVITYRDLSKAQCSALASSRFNRNFWLGIKDIKIINGNDVYTFDWDSREMTLPIDRRKAADICHMGSNISFRFE